MGDVNNPATLEDIAKQFNITPETLGSVLIDMSSANHTLRESINVAQDVAELYNRQKNGDKLTDEEQATIDKMDNIALEYTINKYFDRVESDPGEYYPEIQETIDTLTKERQEGETLDECIARVLEPSIYTFSMSPEGKRQVPALTEEERSLLFNDHVPQLNAELTNLLYSLSTKNFTTGPTPNTAIYDIDEYNRVVIEGVDLFTGLSTSPLKLLDAILAYFTYDNTSKATTHIQTTIEIPLNEYAQTRGIDLTQRNYPDPEVQKKQQRKRSNAKYNFKKDVERDLNSLDKFRISGRVVKGNAKGDYENLVLIYPDHSVANGIIQVTIPDDTAEYLIKSNYITPYDPELQRLDDRNPNLYRIARKISLQHGNRQNQNAGTANTLRVSTLIDSTPYIPDINTLKGRGSRNWKEKIKQPIEEVLNGLQKSGFLTSWTYKDPKSKKNYTPEEAGTLTGNAYVNLNVNYKLRKETKK